jgi:hypothetical protein
MTSVSISEWTPSKSGGMRVELLCIIHIRGRNKMSLELPFELTFWRPSYYYIRRRHYYY